MIRIDQPEEEPEVLRTRGKKRRRVMASLYTRFSEDYNQGKKTFTFDSRIYGHPSVKETLIETHHGKCCYCEMKLRDGDIEHFRPKGQVAEDNAHPGYYWLAYEWSNLLFACKTCNQRFKRTFFPLRDPSKRARSHRDNLMKEEPLLIHPAEEDPERFIGFQKHEAVVLHPRGKVTIEVLGLNQRELLEARLDQYEDLKWLNTIIQLKKLLPPDVVKDAQADLDKAVSNQAQYSAMARAALKAGFPA